MASHEIARCGVVEHGGVICIPLRHGGSVEIGENWTRVRLANGGEVYGEPQGTDEQDRISWELGYFGDTVAMCRDHDPLHAILLDMLGLHSFSMRDAVGLLDKGSAELADLEEQAVMALQRFMRALGIDAAELARRNGYVAA